MPAFKVSWVIDITADSPLEAAREALRIQRDPDSTAVVFDVREADDDQDETLEQIDLAMFRRPK